MTRAKPKRRSCGELGKVGLGNEGEEEERVGGLERRVGGSSWLGWWFRVRVQGGEFCLWVHERGYEELRERSGVAGVGSRTRTEERPEREMGGLRTS
jgi:hypothetical protein